MCSRTIHLGTASAHVDVSVLVEFDGRDVFIICGGHETVTGFRTAVCGHIVVLVLVVVRW